MTDFHPIPPDDELDAAVARLEPRLFMTLGARSRRRRLARILGGTTAGAGLVAAGLAIGVFLLPAPVSTVASPPRPSASAPAPTTAPIPTPGELGATIVCHASDGSVTARVQLIATANSPSALCAGVATSTRGTGQNAGTARIACTASDGSIAVYPARPNDSATSVCASHGTELDGTNK